MIRSDIDIKDYVYGILKDSALASEVSGRVYKDQRPLNSKVEDIVISVLARDAGSQIQEAVVNINVYVPDIKRQQDTVEDIPRLRTLCTLALQLLEYGSASGILYQLEMQQVIESNDETWHCINNRLRIRFNNE